MPPWKLQKLKLETLRKSSETYVDPELAKHFMDLVYNVEMKDSKRRGTISLLLEHKSTVVRETPLQVLRYMVNFWYDTINNGRIPLIIPIVFYQDRLDRTVSTSFSGLLEEGHTWSKTLPDFQYHFYELKDLARSLEDAILPELQLYRETMRLVQSIKEENGEVYYSHFITFVDFLKESFVENESLWETVGRVACIYMLKAIPPEESLKIATRLVQELPEKSEDLMTVVDALKEEGKKS